MPGSKLACLWIIAGLALVAVGCSGHAEYGRRPGEAPGPPEKVALCHKGKKTLHVAEAAAKAHYGHGDTPGPCAR